MSRPSCWLRRAARSFGPSDTIAISNFAIQDEITTSLAACITPEINKAESLTRARLSDAELSAWDCFLKGLWRYYAASDSDLLEAAVWFRRAGERDLASATSKAWLAIVLVHAVQVGAVRSTRELWSEAMQLAQQAVRLDPRSQGAFNAFAFVNAFAGNHDAGIEAGEHAITLNVHDPSARFTLGQCYFTAGKHTRALEMFSAAMRLSANSPDMYHWAAMSAFSHFLLGNFDAALSWAIRPSTEMPGICRCWGCEPPRSPSLEEARSPPEPLRNSWPMLRA